VVEHFLDTECRSQRSAPVIGGFSRGSTLQSNIPPNKVPNTGRFRRVERCLHRHVRSGELWFVGRQGGKVIWRRLRTHDLHVARVTVAMREEKPNGNMEIFLVTEDGKRLPLPEAKPDVREEPLPRVRQVMLPADSPTEPAKGLLATQPAPSGPVPILDEFINRWRRGKGGLKPATGVWTFSAGLTSLDDIKPEGSGTDLPPGPHALGR